MQRSSRRASYFYPRSPCGERQLIACLNGLLRDFYPRSPCGERLTSEVSERVPLAISIHALLAESDRRYHTTDRVTAYISIHALLAESDPSVLHNFRPLQISIHALLAESDSAHPETRQRDAISIHALLAESDHHQQ